MTAEFIAAHRTDRGVPHAVSCRALDVAPSTFYKHLDRLPTLMQLRRRALDAEVRRAFGRSQGTYGSPRVRAQLRRDGLSVSNKTVEASMARQGLCARPKNKKGLTSQNPGNAAPTGLLGRDFSADGINQKQFGDFKEVKTGEGPVLLATVLDLCSRRMAGFATSEGYPTAELAKAAINTAAATRGGDIKGVVFHSDKGTQYTAGAFAKACDRLGIRRSTGRTGNALDNAPAESFFPRTPTRAHRPALLGHQSPSPPRNIPVGPHPAQPTTPALRHRNGPTSRTRTRPHPKPPQPTSPRLGGKLKTSTTPSVATLHR